eukprot:CAMPEP_0114439134 /NCGR_PEP_ID=MMETSP0103-20121206/15027_1 /TAXON_ID=37642 ORGANISM="Paraphysomonas imperforata, Strain PA2" /NCGR_SAMPLE_ID=MMETSP0103 /ASSEMBLY_ACC=CAM_ASM_000201 /LENGTH=197 /DNA_ID=CAMNT_0001609857 /DNA_START=349 /DNA_END=940 /DNA_ORIENTATION=+
MTLTVQNGPSDVLFQLHGRQKYRCAHAVLRRLMPLCYSVCYDNLSCSVFPLGDLRQQLMKSTKADVEVKVKWVLQGCHHPPFFLYQPPDYLVSAGSSNKEVLLEAYCYYRFDSRSGRLVSHVIDWVAAVPPVDLQLELELAQPGWGKRGGSLAPQLQLEMGGVSVSLQSGENRAMNLECDYMVKKGFAGLIESFLIN